MRWKSGRRSSNVEDRRGGRIPMSRGVKIGGGTAIIALLLSLLLGQDPTGILQQMSEGQSASVPTQASAAEDEAAQFVAVVLGDTEDTWTGIFAAAGSQYIKPKLVLFSDAVQSACGYNTAATGPFYCPGDQKVYLDFSATSKNFRHKVLNAGPGAETALDYLYPEAWDFEYADTILRLVDYLESSTDLPAFLRRNNARCNFHPVEFALCEHRKFLTNTPTAYAPSERPF